MIGIKSKITFENIDKVIAFLKIRYAMLDKNPDSALFVESRAWGTRGLLRLLVPIAKISVKHKKNQLVFSLTWDRIGTIVYLVLIGMVVFEVGFDRVTFPRKYPATLPIILFGLYTTLATSSYYKLSKNIRLLESELISKNK